MHLVKSQKACTFTLMVTNNRMTTIRLLRAWELKSFRKQSGITQEILSQLSGLSRQTIINIEKAKIGWNVDSEILYFEAIKKYNLDK